MTTLVLKAEIKFKEGAVGYFRFPITNSIRLSFWLQGESFSTFAEMEILSEPVEIGVQNVVAIELIERDFLIGRLEAGQEFRMGVFPVEIAEGKIVSVHRGEDDQNVL